MKWREGREQGGFAHDHNARGTNEESFAPSAKA